MVVGGQKTAATPTADLKRSNHSNNSWVHYHLTDLSYVASGRPAVNNNTIIIIGGYTNGGSELSSVTVVELGQAELHVSLLLLNNQINVRYLTVTS